MQKMVKEIITFGDTEIKKRKFRHCKYLILLEDVDIDNILVSNMAFRVKNLPLRIMLPKTSPYINSCDSETRWMIFLTKDDELLKKLNDI